MPRWTLGGVHKSNICAHVSIISSSSLKPRYITVKRNVSIRVLPCNPELVLFFPEHALTGNIRGFDHLSATDGLGRG